MKRNQALPFILLGFFLIFWTNIPKTVSEKLRCNAVAFFSPVLKGFEKAKDALSDSAPERPEFQLLQLQNQQLRSKLEMAYEWLAWERSQKEGPQVFDGTQSFMKERLHLESAAIPAIVIYRDPSSWSSSLWIKAGEEDNRLLGKTVVARNSPVVSGAYLVGVVDYVGKTQSRVRLITDSGVVPAVRAVRGGAQNRDIASLCRVLCQRLQSRDDLKGQIQGFIDQLGKEGEDLYLAKGELQGSSAPLWRSRSPVLKGVGFNYEYGDSRGDRYDLRSVQMPLLKAGDLLATSGLDGVFPEGLIVGYVTTVEPLKEGSYSYDLTARPALGAIHDIKTVFILPPVSSE